MLPSNASDFEATHPKAGGPRRGGGLLVMLGMLIILVAIIAVAVTRLPTGSLSRPPTTSASAPNNRPAAPAAPAQVGAPADAATQQAIRQVIEGLDNAQAQAIATNDQTVMAATATPDFYAQEATNNQEMLAGGVTEVKLLKIEWGDVTTDGATATATAYETWSTTFSDGTTQEGRDRNVYTLVQDNGTWKVQADVHPDSPIAPAGP